VPAARSRTSRGEEPDVAAFRAGDDGSLATLYARWSPVVYSLALRSLADVGEAEQVTQRVFTQAWTGRATFDPARSSFSDWLLALACRRIADARAEAARRSTSATNTKESAEDESKTGVLAERFLVADGMSHLDTSSRRVLLMALDHDLTFGEIAGRTGLRVEEVRSRAATGLTELRQQREAQADAH
jgi:RNA polymerase sigma factor (sigma-70 family)